eukprot:scaffold360_cov374-Pavlova_lutheri.AAC.44
MECPCHETIKAKKGSSQPMLLVCNDSQQRDLCPLRSRGVATTLQSRASRAMDERHGEREEAWIGNAPTSRSKSQEPFPPWHASTHTMLLSKCFSDTCHFRKAQVRRKSNGQAMASEASMRLDVW